MDFKIRTEADKKAVCEYLSKLDISQREYAVKVAKKADKRTLSQNRLYYLWLNCISAETGNDVEDLHEYFKLKFIGIHSRIIYGENVVRTYSTTDLNTEQFTAYLDKVQRWANVEQGIILPNPDDMYWEQFYNEYNR
jgi:hypothetical protein